jgi:hypothetical protein
MTPEESNINKEWISLKKSYPKENETVWLYNANTNHIALGLRVWINDGDDSGWMWAISNGIIYSENGRIVSECETDDDYEFTHFSRLPVLPTK